MSENKIETKVESIFNFNGVYSVKLGDFDVKLNSNIQFKPVKGAKAECFLDSSNKLIKVNFYDIDGKPFFGIKKLDLDSGWSYFLLYERKRVNKKITKIEKVKNYYKIYCDNFDYGILIPNDFGFSLSVNMDISLLINDMSKNVESFIVKNCKEVVLIANKEKNDWIFTDFQNEKYRVLNQCSNKVINSEQIIMLRKIAQRLYEECAKVNIYFDVKKYLSKACVNEDLDYLEKLIKNKKMFDFFLKSYVVKQQMIVQLGKTDYSK